MEILNLQESSEKNDSFVKYKLFFNMEDNFPDKNVILKIGSYCKSFTSLRILLIGFNSIWIEKIQTVIPWTWITAASTENQEYGENCKFLLLNKESINNLKDFDIIAINDIYDYLSPNFMEIFNKSKRYIIYSEFNKNFHKLNNFKITNRFKSQTGHKTLISMEKNYEK